VVVPDNLLKKDLLLIWVHLGIGCQMYLNVFFADFGKKPSDYYELIKLAPAYQVYFGINDFVTISDNLPKIIQTFESIESGSGKKLASFMKEAQSNYNIAIKDLVYRPGVSPLELITVETALKVNQFFGNISKDIRRRFKNKN